MKKWAIILIVVIVFLLILIAVFTNYDVAPVVDNYSQIEIDMRRLWY